MDGPIHIYFIHALLIQVQWPGQSAFPFLKQASSPSPRSLLSFTAPGSCSTPSAAPQSVVFLIWRLTLVWSSKELSPWYHPTHLSIFVPTFMPVLLCLSWKSPWWWNTKRVDTQPLHLLSAFLEHWHPHPSSSTDPSCSRAQKVGVSWAEAAQGPGTRPSCLGMALTKDRVGRRWLWEKLVREVGLKWSLCWPLPGTCLPSINRWGAAPPMRGSLSIGVERSVKQEVGRGCLMACVGSSEKRSPYWQLPPRTSVSKANREHTKMEGLPSHSPLSCLTSPTQLPPPHWWWGWGTCEGP